jgi:hypothetical protein
MENISFIGTLHLGLTNLKELKDILDSLSPDLLLVEITSDDLAKDNLATYPEEMVFCVKYYKSKEIDCKGFDVDIDVINKKLSNEDVREIGNKQIEFISNYNWKDFNNDNLIEMLGSIAPDLFDRKKWSLRQSKMKQNILKLSKGYKRVVVICGCSHIPFFEKEFKSSKFPLRK